MTRLAIRAIDRAADPDFVGGIPDLDRQNRLPARDDRRRLFWRGNRRWHSDSSFKPIPAQYSALSARVIPATGGDAEFAAKAPPLEQAA